jgi:sigma-54 specific flagellar transcriptional regulator A
MQGSVKLLVIDDNAQVRRELHTILNFIGEPCTIVDSKELQSTDFSTHWSGCILGHIETSLDTVLQSLKKANHIPLLALGHKTQDLDELTNYVGELEHPLNYPQLSDALRHCKEFQGRKGIQVSNSGRKK